MGRHGRHSDIGFNHMKLLTTVSVTATAFLLHGCARNELPRPADLPNFGNLPFVHKIDIQQGNVVTQDMLAQLQPGMDKKKVNFIMGSPIILDTFHSNRWDYLYTFQAGGGRVKRRQVTLYFDDDKLARMEGDIKPAEGKLVVDTRQDTTVAVPGEYNPSLLTKLKDTIPFVGEDAPKEKKTDAKQDSTPSVAATPTRPTLTPVERAALEEQGEPGILAKLQDAIPFSGDQPRTEEAAAKIVKDEVAAANESAADEAVPAGDDRNKVGVLAKLKGALPFSDSDNEAGESVDDTSAEESSELETEEDADEPATVAVVAPLVPTGIPLDNSLARDTDADSTTRERSPDNAEQEVVVPKERQAKKRGFFARLFGRDRDDSAETEPDARERRRYRDLSEPEGN
jgi:outer membrane protein assembly factor BamE